MLLSSRSLISSQARTRQGRSGTAVVRCSADAESRDRSAKKIAAGVSGAALGTFLLPEAARAAPKQTASVQAARVPPQPKAETSVPSNLLYGLIFSQTIALIGAAAGGLRARAKCGLVSAASLIDTVCITCRVRFDEWGSGWCWA